MSEESLPSVDMRAAFAELGRVTLARESMESVAQRVVDLTVQAIAPAAAVSITLLSNDGASSLACSGELARSLDESQYGHGYGPCLEAAAGGAVVEVADVRAETRWPLCMGTFAGQGVLSSLAVPVPVVAMVTAALNLYALEVAAFSDEDRRVALQFASYAGVAVANMYDLESARSQAENLQTAMASRAVIEQAKGVLVERYKVTPEEAFRLLAAVSMRVNVKLRDVAENLVITGDFAF